MARERHFFGLAALGFILAVYALPGCEPPAADSCATTDDCFGGEVCEEGRCERTPVDNGDGAGGDGFDTGEGLPACDDDEQCDNGTCDLSSHTCVCEAGFHHCGGSCVPDDSPATCGTRCNPCPTTDGRRALCGAGECLPGPLPTRIAAGNWHSCALTSSGEVQCWGDDTHGQTGPRPGLFAEITAGGEHSCALTSGGEVECWGWEYGETGDYEAPPGVFIQLSAGAYHDCALTQAGEVVCWGGDGQDGARVRSGDFVQVSAGQSHTCALTRTGAVECWGGGNLYGEHDPPQGETFIQISAGDSFTCGVTAERAHWCWGSEVPGASPAPTGSFTQVSAGRLHACAVYDGTGEVICWGVGSAAEAEGRPERVTEVSAGRKHTCALTSGGEVKCWGSDDNGQSSPQL